MLMQQTGKKPCQKVEIIIDEKASRRRQDWKNKNTTQQLSLAVCATEVNNGSSSRSGGWRINNRCHRDETCGGHDCGASWLSPAAPRSSPPLNRNFLAIDTDAEISEKRMEIIPKTTHNGPLSGDDIFPLPPSLSLPYPITWTVGRPLWLHTGCMEKKVK